MSLLQKMSFQPQHQQLQRQHRYSLLQDLDQTTSSLKVSMARRNLIFLSLELMMAIELWYLFQKKLRNLLEMIESYRIQIGAPGRCRDL